MTNSELQVTQLKGQVLPNPALYNTFQPLTGLLQTLNTPDTRGVQLGWPCGYHLPWVGATRVGDGWGGQFLSRKHSAMSSCCGDLSALLKLTTRGVQPVFGSETRNPLTGLHWNTWLKNAASTLKLFVLRTWNSNSLSLKYLQLSCKTDFSS